MISVFLVDKTIRLMTTQDLLDEPSILFSEYTLLLPPTYKKDAIFLGSSHFTRLPETTF